MTSSRPSPSRSKRVRGLMVVNAGLPSTWATWTLNPLRVTVVTVVVAAAAGIAVNARPARKADDRAARPRRTVYIVHSALPARAAYRRCVETASSGRLDTPSGGAHAVLHARPSAFQVRPHDSAEHPGRVDPDLVGGEGEHEDAVLGEVPVPAQTPRPRLR